MRRHIHRTWPRLLAMSLALSGLSLASAAGAKEPAPASRRAALLETAERGPAAIPQLSAALQDDNAVVRRTAARILAVMGRPARPALARALGNSDFVVRQAALRAVCSPLVPGSLPYLERAMKDQSPAMRLAAVNLLIRMKPRAPAVTRALERARADRMPAIRSAAARALWPFTKETILVRDRKDWDHEVHVSRTIPLPKEGWRFQADPKQDGHLRKWYEPDFDDTAWTPIHIEEAWESQGHPGLDGVAWYRGAFDLPAKPDLLAVEIRFEGVDECAWVWINGRFAGQHDIGPEGWDKPFALDITGDVRWGERNRIAVRVEDSAQAGGIWKPVRIEALK